MMGRGESILDKLDQLRLDMLKGSVPKEKLIELAQVLREKRPSCDHEELNACLDDIELRAEVELAKLTR